jgi:hypothetical protein
MIVSAVAIAAFAALTTLLLRLTEPVAVARREVREHNLSSLHASEDVASWVRDEHQALGRRLTEIDEELNRRNLYYSGERGHRINEAKRDQARRWRDRERAFRRTVDQVHAQEGFWHRFWRTQVPKPLRLPPWPEESYPEDVQVIADSWRDDTVG